jgi:hypothetical protein
VLIGPNAQGDYTEGPSLPGGYVTVNGQQVPGPLLQSALDYVNDALQQMADTIQADGETDSTAIILTAKHGQSPLNNSQLQRIDDGPIIAGVNAAWAAEHPSNRRWSSKRPTTTGCCGGCRTARRRRLTSSRTTCGRTAPRRSTTPARRSPSSTPAWRRSSPASSRRVLRRPNSDPHHPDVFGIAQVGTIYTTGSKIAEHGGDNPGDRDVPLVVYAPGTVRPGQSSNGWKRPRSLRRS